MNNYDVILSYREIDERGFIRRIVSFLHEKTVQIIFGVKFRSINSQFKIINSKLIKKFSFYDNHWMHELEILLNIHYKK